MPYTVRIASLPVIQPRHGSAALLDHLARRVRLRAESVIAPLGLRPRHLVALTVLRDGGGSTQQALSTTLQIDGTNLVGLLNELEADRRIAVVGEAATGEEAVALARRTGPDVVLIDAGLPGLDSVEATGRICAACSGWSRLRCRGRRCGRW